jgi:hypothetical protein
VRVTRCFLPCYASPVKTKRPDLRFYRSQPKPVTILPDLTCRTVQIRSHQNWRASILLPPQTVTTTTARKVRGKEIRTVPQAKESATSSSEEGRSCIRRLRAAASAKHQVPQTATTLPRIWALCNMKQECQPSHRDI